MQGLCWERQRPRWQRPPGSQVRAWWRSPFGRPSLRSCSQRSRIIVAGEGYRLKKVRANWRVWLAFVHDVSAAALAWVGLYWLRANMDLHEPQLSDMWHTLAWILPL